MGYIKDMSEQNQHPWRSSTTTVPRGAGRGPSESECAYACVRVVEAYAAWRFYGVILGGGSPYDGRGPTGAI